MATTTPNYDVNLEDERFQQVNTEKENALTDVKNTYDGMINQSDDFYNAQIQASKDWADQQQQIQQEQTDFTIEQIEQQQEQAEKDYKKEQSGAYVDWQKQSNNYGVNAEQMAASGLSTTGYAESSRVGMYNTYQNRVVAAREGFNQATLNYNNAMKEAQLQNSAAKAEIALQAYKEQCALLLEGFQYKNSLLLEQQNQLQATEDRFYSRWQDVYNQIMQENAFKEDIRRYEEEKLYQQEQDRIAQENWQKEYELMQQEYEANSGYLDEKNEQEEPTVYADNQPEKEETYVKPLEKQKDLSNFNELSKLRTESQTINGQKATFSGISASILPSGEGFDSKAGIMKANGKYYAWNDVAEDYIDVTSLVTSENGQPMYINNTKVEAVSSELQSFYRNKLGFSKDKTFWKAGGKVYAYDPNSKEYEETNIPLISKQPSKGIDWGKVGEWALGFDWQGLVKGIYD